LSLGSKGVAEDASVVAYYVAYYIDTRVYKVSISFLSQVTSYSNAE
jgi:hypothetical protein